MSSDIFWKRWSLVVARGISGGRSWSLSALS
jgi:hypothetical protein